MNNVLVLGLGRIGGAIGRTLNQNNQYQVVGADINAVTAQHYSQFFTTHHISQNNLQSLIADCDAVISALTFNENPMVADLALREGCHYFDLTEDIRCTSKIKEISLQAKPGQVFMPQCGLAPGFIDILGYSFVKQFDELHSLQLRVGALPEYPSNQMMYNLTWSTDGLINEYANLCDAIKNGQKVAIEPLEGREQFSISGVEYEAFNTSGGLGTLCETLEDRIQELTYKTVRYPGHCELMRFLFRDLRLGEEGERRAMLKTILESSVAVTKQDTVIIKSVAIGKNQGQLEQKSRTFRISHKHDESAIQMTTTSGVLTIVDMVLSGQMADTGFVKQESIAIDDFLKNSFAKVYRDSEL